MPVTPSPQGGRPRLAGDRPAGRYGSPSPHVLGASGAGGDVEAGEQLVVVPRCPGPSRVGARSRMGHPATSGLAQTPSSSGYLASASRRSPAGSTGALRQII